MLQKLHLIIYIAAILMIGCTGNDSHPFEAGRGRGHVPQASDTLYTEQAAMDVYGTQPERALVIIDSAEIVGNLTEDRASLLRAKVFCLTCGEERLDTARQICEALLQSDFAKAEIKREESDACIGSPEHEQARPKVKDVPDNRESVLDLLVTISRKKHDNEQWLRWATEKADFCRQQDNETEALRTEAEIGIILTHLGRQDEGMAKLDNVIRQLDGTRKFNETDACIIALRRKADVLDEQGLYADIIPLAEKIVEKMNDYEQHPDEFHDGTYREPDAADVPGYCDFYRTKGYAYLALAYASLSEKGKVNSEKLATAQKAREYLALFEQSQWGQTFDGRKMIAPTWCKLGDYDKMLAVYDEMEQLMGTDTICFDYATILHDRAVAYAALSEKGIVKSEKFPSGVPLDEGKAAANSSLFTHHFYLEKAYDYMSRYAALSQSLNDSLQASEAHEYAARYHAQEQQLQIEHEQAKNARKNIYIWSFVIISILAIAIAAILFYGNREIKRKNRILAQQIAEALTTKEQLKEKQQTVTPTDISDDPSMLSDADLFQHLSAAIERERLFLDPACDRQMLTDRFSLSKERIGNAFVRGGGYKNVSAYVNTLRLDFAAQMLTDRPDLDVSQVAQTSGFSSHRYFSTCFKQHFGLSPSDYREARSKQN